MATAQALIPVFNGTINNEQILLCDARKLHAFLKVGKRFASWIAERITEYGFVENQDFAIASQNREAKTRGGHNRKDYHLTLDTAKELSMVERNEQGRIIRRYFIECERRLLAIANGATQTTVDERTPLRAAVDMLVGKKSLLYPDAYAIVHQRFGVTSIDQLSLEQIPQAVEYVHKLVLEGEVLPAEPLKPTLTEADLRSISILCGQMMWIRGWWEKFEPGIRTLHPKLASSVHDHFTTGAAMAMSVTLQFGLTVPDRRYVANYPWLGDSYDREQYKIRYYA